jgi:MFS family permease
VPATPAPAENESSLRYPGWRVVFAAFLMSLFVFGFGLYGQSVFLAELQRLHGWASSLISAGSTLMLGLSSILLVFAGNLIGRFGPRNVALTGLAALTLSTSLLAVVTTPWQLYVAFLLMAIGWFGLGTVTISTVISHWFDRRRGLAISIALNGATSGGIVIAPLLVVLVERLGFKAAMLGMTAAMIVVVLPAVLIWMRYPPRPPAGEALTARATSDTPWTRARALRNFAFWSFSGAFAMALIAQVAFIVHQIPILEPSMGREGAGLAVAVMTLMALIGRLTLGLFVDRLAPRPVAALSFLSQVVALLAMTLTDNPVGLIAACALYGVSVGNNITLPAIVVQREFPLASFALILGLSTAIGGLHALGPVLIGVIRDATGGYTAALLVCAGLKLVAAAAILSGRRQARRGDGRADQE